MLSLQAVTKRFGAIVAVDDLTLSIQPGEVFGLLGPNGAGKTTTVSMAVGLLTPDSGSVTLGGLGSPNDPAVRARIGVAPQSLALYDELSGAENARFFGSMFGLTGKTLRERVATALDLVGLADRQRDRVAGYSGGMKRRLNLAVAIMHEPDLLLLDEPTVGVDSQSRNAIFEQIERLRSDGRTIIYTTHYMEEAQRLCDRVAIIDHGRVMALDTVDGLLASHGGKHRVMAQRSTGWAEVASDDPIATLRQLQDEQDLLSFHVERPNLETVFLNLTGRSLRE
ncbi:MAG: ABC transporter ATP-binding protein [Phycisphaerales bacterium]|nr:ABC transporter ATP-binding protein [Phycisphaerales bacterium]